MADCAFGQKSCPVLARPAGPTKSVEMIMLFYIKRKKLLIQIYSLQLYNMKLYPFLELNTH